MPLLKSPQGRRGQRLQLLKQPQERREHRRIKIRVRGRYVLSDEREYPCTIIDVSLGGLAVMGPEAGARGERVVIYADRLGRVMGSIARHFAGGFAVELDMAGFAERRFAERIHQLDAPIADDGRRRFWQRKRRGGVGGGLPSSPSA